MDRQTRNQRDTNDGTGAVAMAAEVCSIATCPRYPGTPRQYCPSSSCSPSGSGVASGPRNARRGRRPTHPHRIRPPPHGLVGFSLFRVGGLSTNVSAMRYRAVIFQASRRGSIARFNGRAFAKVPAASGWSRLRFSVPRGSQRQSAVGQRVLRGIRHHRHADC